MTRKNARIRPDWTEWYTQNLSARFPDMLESQNEEHTLSLMKPGAKPAEVAAAHDEWMEARGPPPEARLYAHGQGCEMGERPLIRRHETIPLAENICLAVHPGHDDGEVFAVICVNYLVAADGVSDCVNKTDKKIFEL